MSDETNLSFNANFGVTTDERGNVKEWKNMADETNRAEELAKSEEAK